MSEAMHRVETCASSWPPKTLGPRGSNSLPGKGSTAGDTPCPRKPFPCVGKTLGFSFPNTEISDLAVASQAPVGSAPLMGIVNPWKSLEAAEFQRLAGGRCGVHWSVQASVIGPCHTHGWGCCQSLSRPRVPASQCRTRAEPPRRE
ncbi:hypothetical protein H8959_017320 [Pygathrix nigripes]